MSAYIKCFYDEMLALQIYSLIQNKGLTKNLLFELLNVMFRSWVYKKLLLSQACENAELTCIHFYKLISNND